MQITSEGHMSGVRGQMSGKNGHLSGKKWTFERNEK